MRCVRRIRQTYQYLILFLTALHVNFIFLQVTTEYKAFIGFTFSCSIFKNKNINIEMCDAKRIRQYITLLASVMYWHSSEVSIHEVFKKLISVNLTHNFRQKTFRIVIIGFTDILSEEHKFTYVWLKSWKRAVLNRKIISGVGKENWHWVNMVELSPLPHTVPVLLCCLLLLHLVGGSPPLKWQDTPEAGSLVARSRWPPLSPGIAVLPVRWQAKHTQSKYSMPSHIHMAHAHICA